MLRRKWKIAEKEHKVTCWHHHPAAEGVTLPCWHSPDSWGIRQEGWCSPGRGFHWWSLGRPSAEGARRNPLREEAVQTDQTAVQLLFIAALSWLVSHRKQSQAGLASSFRTHTHSIHSHAREPNIRCCPASYLGSRWAPSSWCWPCCCCHSWCDRRWRADDASRAAESEAQSYTKTQEHNTEFFLHDGVHD